jgi:hypothetical protein
LPAKRCSENDTISYGGVCSFFADVQDNAAVPGQGRFAAIADCQQQVDRFSRGIYENTRLNLGARRICQLDVSGVVSRFEIDGPFVRQVVSVGVGGACGADWPNSNSRWAAASPRARRTGLPNSPTRGTADRSFRSEPDSEMCTCPLLSVAGAC